LAEIKKMKEYIATISFLIMIGLVTVIQIAMWWFRYKFLKINNPQNRIGFLLPANLFKPTLNDMANNLSIMIPIPFGDSQMIIKSEESKRFKYLANRLALAWIIGIILMILIPVIITRISS
jgi:hypothetical protein